MSVTGTADRIAYRLRHRARATWYYAHLYATGRIAGHEEEEAEASSTDDRAALQERMRDLYRRDWRNIEAGLYLPPEGFDGPGALLAKSRLYFRDLKAIHRRRRDRAVREVATADARARYPGYYLQNFHFQTDGYLSPHSARLYDFQVETLFSGAAQTMRRQALAPLSRFFADRGLRDARLLDVASGTGRLLCEVKANWPKLQVTALDLSADYLATARDGLAAWTRAGFVQANAEAMPLADASQDAVTAVFLFHELPRRARVNVAREIGRVLRPGGLFVLIDSIQLGDAAELDRHIEKFPRDFHEPYYADYARADLAALFGDAGLRLLESDLAVLAKVMVFEKA
jgi:ubiquinone/menaquinone biosynthesis C-methylase UbiE